MAVTKAEGFPIQTSKARLKRSLITGKYLLFSSAEENDQLIQSSFPCEATVDVQAVNCMTEEEHCEFRYPDLSDDYFLSSKIKKIVYIGTDSEADEELAKKD